MLGNLVSGMQALWHRHELLTNNLANAGAAGYKQDQLMLFSGMMPGRTGASAPAGVSPIGAHAIAHWTDFSQASFRQTGRELDVAIDGSGFFVVDTARGPRYTRSGALGMSRDGYLVTGSGDRVQGERGPIAVRSSKLLVTTKGEVQENGRTLDTLKVVDFPKPYLLLKEGAGYFVPAGAAMAPAPAQNYQVLGETLEESNVNPVHTMVQMIEMLRHYESAQRAIQSADEADRFAANDMGRV